MRRSHWVTTQLLGDGQSGQACRTAGTLLLLSPPIAQALHQLGEPTFTIADGKSVDWRADFYTALTAKGVKGKNDNQLFWVNEIQKFAEGIPHITTAFVIRS